MKKKFLLIIIILLTSGCSYTELNDLAIASSVGIDYEKKEFIITAQILDVKNGDSGITEESAVIYQAKGKTLAEAISSFYTRYPKKIYFGHIEINIISENAIKEKADDIFDYFVRSPEVRTTGYIIITKDKKASEIINPKNEAKGTFPAEDIKSTLMQSTKRNGTINDLTVEDFLSNYLKPGLAPVLPLISIKEKGMTSSSTMFEGSVPVYNKNVYKKLTTNQSKAYNTIFNNYEEISIALKYKDKLFGATVYNPNSKIKVKIKKNKVYVDININIESVISEITIKQDLNNNNKRKQLKKQIEKEMYKNTYSLINYCKENNVDLLGIRNEIYKNYFHDYKKYKNKNIYKTAKIKVHIKNDLYQYGNIYKGAL